MSTAQCGWSGIDAKAENGGGVRGIAATMAQKIDVQRKRRQLRIDFRHAHRVSRYDAHSTHQGLFYRQGAATHCTNCLGA